MNICTLYLQMYYGELIKDKRFVFEGEFRKQKLDIST